MELGGLVEGTIYLVESIDIRKRGQKRRKNKMKFITETDHLLVFQYQNGLRECFCKTTPKDELIIKRFKKGMKI